MMRFGFALALIGGSLTWFTPQQQALAQTLDCASTYQIDTTLPNGARWQMCWEHRYREGIVLHDIHYTAAHPEATNPNPQLILNQASLAQIHVPYDDNGARYHDVSDYGLGGANLNDLTSADCPNGTLLQFGSKDVICRTVGARGFAYTDEGQSLQGDWLRLFSVSHVGAYNYIPEWRFHDDGTIEPIMGATGALQRRTTNPSYTQYGWPLATGNIGISHLHNYYWRLDFDLAGSANDDIVEELELLTSTGTDNPSRQLSVTTFTTEAARSIAPERLRSWRIRDANQQNANGYPLSYHIEPSMTGHRDQGPSYEPWTFNDFYVTRQKSCEKYASHNPAFGGCAADLSQFVNGQSLVNADLVVWYGLTFHHIPRQEDEPRMNAHWNGFQITPRDWSAYNPLLTPATSGLAQITSPAAETTLPPGDVTFTWSDVGAEQYWLEIGSELGVGGFYGQDQGTELAATVTGLPQDGRTLYARLWTIRDGFWQSQDFQFTAANTGTSGLAELLSPVPNSTLEPGTVTFSWSDVGAEQYWLEVGNGPDGYFYGQDQGTNTSASVSGISEDGGTVYVRLWTIRNGFWEAVTVQYTAADTGGTGLAEILSPSPNSTLEPGTVTFSWSDVGAEQYWLEVGAGPGNYVYGQDQGTNTSAIVTDLPTDGSTISARLWTIRNGLWQFVDTEFTAASP